MEQQVLFEVAEVGPSGRIRIPAPNRRSRQVGNPGGLMPPGPPFGPGLDGAQAAVVTHRGGPLLVLAGPGTGRTTALVAAVSARLGPGPGQVPGERILVLTAGGRRAATELREAIARQSPGATPPLVTTFHALAHWVLRGQSDPAGPPLRLLTAPEQEARLRELLTGAVAAGRLAWPDELSAALGTRGIGHEVRDLLARARGLGLDGPGLGGLGRRHGVPGWQAIGSFLDEYLDALDFEGVIDYSELMFRVMVLAHKRRDGAALRGLFDLIVVDEYQDVEPVGVALLHALASEGADLVVAGDPDMAMFGFRGSQLGAVARFPARFAGPTGQPAPIVVLSARRRIAPGILTAAQRVLAPVTLAPLPAAVQREHRSGASEPGGSHRAADRASDAVAVDIYPSARAQAVGISERLVRASAQGLKWQDMAVVVRNPTEQLELLRAGLAAAGVPATLRAGEPPLSRQPAVRVLMELLAAAIDRAVEAVSGGAGTVDLGGGPAPDWDPAALITSAVGGADSVDVHLLGRALAAASSRQVQLGGSAAGILAVPSRGSAASLRWALSEPQQCAELVSAPALWAPPQLASLRRALDAVSRVASVVRAAADGIAGGWRPQEVLWSLWSGSTWPVTLRQQALAGGADAAPAHTAIDAIMELFELAGRLPTALRGLPGAVSLHAEISAHDVPVELRAGTRRHPDAVTVCSVHQARGSSWPLVVVAGVQEGRWPDLRRRANLLRSDELGATGPVAAPGAADRLVAERRLMYVACTRASKQLVVTAVADPGAGLAPSRFISELEVDVSFRHGTPAGAATAVGVASRLRALLGHEREQVRQAAIARLADLAARSGPAGGPLVPGADTQGWWFARPISGSGSGGGDLVVPAGTGPAVRLSASTLAGLQECPLRWFLQRRAGAAQPATPAMALGRLMHNLADQLAQSGPLPDEQAALARIVELEAAADRDWGQLDFASERESAVLRARASRMIATLVTWHRRSGRRPLASEWAFDVSLATEQGPVRLVGAVDRIDSDEAGGLHVVDFKTSRNPVSKAAAAADAQLAVYQLALAAAVPAWGSGEVAGAELVYLDRPTAGGQPTVRLQPPVARGSWALGLVGQAGQMLRNQRFPARPGPACLRCRFTDICPASKEPDDECDQ